MNLYIAPLIHLNNMHTHIYSHLLFHFFSFISSSLLLNSLLIHSQKLLLLYRLFDLDAVCIFFTFYFNVMYNTNDI